ncbi:MAG: hypothetical protein ACI8RD_001259 [Bacillariaceae sp.]|jgi:hypothetical protein
MYCPTPIMRENTSIEKKIQQTTPPKIRVGCLMYFSCIFYSMKAYMNKIPPLINLNLIVFFIFSKPSLLTTK